MSTLRSATTTTRKRSSPMHIPVTLSSNSKIATTSTSSFSDPFCGLPRYHTTSSALESSSTKKDASDGDHSQQKNHHHHYSFFCPKRWGHRIHVAWTRMIQIWFQSSITTTKKAKPRKKVFFLFISSSLVLFGFVVTLIVSSWYRRRMELFASHQALKRPQEGTNHSHHQHAIPNVLIFTHHINLLTTTFLEDGHTPTTTSRNSHGNDTLTEERQEWLALQANVQNIVALHTTTTHTEEQDEDAPNNNNKSVVSRPENPQTRFLTDADCIESIRRFYQYQDAAAAEQEEELVTYFQNESKGMFKADLCRGVALYETGGLYLDVDLGVRMNLWSVLNPNTQFATVHVHRQSNHPHCFFQAFIAATPHHPILQRYVELFLEYYQDVHQNRHGGHWKRLIKNGPVGVILLKQAYDQIIQTNPELLDTIEIWQEVLYLPEFHNSLLKHVPPPTWGGNRRACKFVVLKDATLPLTVPFYSRIAGSRMCSKSQ